jgi:hypothetical protein
MVMKWAVILDPFLGNGSVIMFLQQRGGMGCCLRGLRQGVKKKRIGATSSVDSWAGSSVLESWRKDLSAGSWRIPTINIRYHEMAVEDLVCSEM